MNFSPLVLFRWIFRSCHGHRREVCISTSTSAHDIRPYRERWPLVVASLRSPKLSAFSLSSCLIIRWNLRDRRAFGALLFKLLNLIHFAFNFKNPPWFYCLHHHFSAQLKLGSSLGWRESSSDSCCSFPLFIREKVVRRSQLKWVVVRLRLQLAEESFDD